MNEQVDKSANDTSAYEFGFLPGFSFNISENCVLWDRFYLEITSIYQKIYPIFFIFV